MKQAKTHFYTSRIFIYGTIFFVFFVIVGSLSGTVPTPPQEAQSIISPRLHDVLSDTSAMPDASLAQPVSSSSASDLAMKKPNDVSKSPQPQTSSKPAPSTASVTTTSSNVSVSPSQDSKYGVQTKTSNCTPNQALPDPACTPGAILTTDTSVICVVGYTTTVRNVSDSLKKKVFAEYGIDYSLHGNYEVDHLISLELGGSNDISNLWPEPHDIVNGSFVKDGFENHLHSQACKGVITMQQAQYEIATNWVKYHTDGTASVSVPSDVVIQTTPPPTVVTPPVADTSSDPAVKKSTSGICHAKGTTYYDRTTSFTSLDNIQACLDSGARLPK